MKLTKGWFSLKELVTSSNLKSHVTSCDIIMLTSHFTSTWDIIMVHCLETSSRDITCCHVTLCVIMWHYICNIKWHYVASATLCDIYHINTKKTFCFFTFAAKIVQLKIYSWISSQILKNFTFPPLLKFCTNWL